MRDFNHLARLKAFSLRIGTGARCEGVKEETAAECTTTHSLKLSYLPEEGCIGDSVLEEEQIARRRESKQAPLGAG
jgi:hypothetical protein